jgi:hypothetical protein
MWTQKATARRVMIQPATETGRKTGPKGLNQGMVDSVVDFEESQYIQTGRDPRF